MIKAKNALRSFHLYTTSAYAVSDRIAMVYRGCIIASGTPAEIQASKLRYVADFVRGNAPANEDLDTLLTT